MIYRSGYSASELMLCHPGLGVIFDVSFGSSCSMMQFIGTVLNNKLVVSLSQYLSSFSSCRPKSRKFPFLTNLRVALVKFFFGLLRIQF